MQIYDKSSLEFLKDYANHQYLLETGGEPISKLPHHSFLLSLMRAMGQGLKNKLFLIGFYARYTKATILQCLPCFGFMW
jgi:hypothetical protein